MRSATFLAAALVLAAPAAQAALSPYYQGIAEIKRILDDPRLEEAMKGQAAITAITRTGDDIYRVENGACSVIVTVVDVPPKDGETMMVGPRQFDLLFGDATCK